MSEEFKNICKVASIYITTVIGAGFASGQEIARFFSSYYRGGFYGILMAGILFATIGWLVLDKVYTGRIKNYEEFLFPTVGGFFGKIIEIVVTVFMFSVYSIMIAGLGSILSTKINMSLLSGVIIMSAICMLIILTDIKGVIAVSTLTTPVLVLGMVFVGLYIIIFKDISVFNYMGGISKVTNNWFFSALIYVSYNSIISIVIMCNMLPYLKTRRTGVAGGIIGGLVLCAIALILNTTIHLFYHDVTSVDFPILSILEKYNVIVRYFYTFILWLAMFTSATTSGYCFVDRFQSKIKIDKRILGPLACIAGIPVASFGFTKLIGTLYTLFGYVGLFLVLTVLIQEVKSRIRS